MTISDQILISVISAFATFCFAALITFIGFWGKIKTELRKEYETRFNERKWEVYSKFINLVPTCFEIDDLYLKQKEQKFSDEINKQLTDKIEYYKETMMKIIQEVLLIGSENVIKWILRFRTAMAAVDHNSELTLVALITLINAMREDLGKNKSNLGYRELGGLYYFSSQIIQEKEKKEKRELFNKPRFEE